MPIPTVTALSLGWCRSELTMARKLAPRLRPEDLKATNNIALRNKDTGSSLASPRQRRASLTGLE